VNIAGLAPAAVPAVGGAYAGAGRYVANSAGVVHVAKREAEADAFYGAYGLGYAGLGYAGLGYAGLGYGYAGLGYAAPAVAAAAPVAAIAPVAASYANVSPSASLTTLGAAPAAIPAVGGAYAGAGRYVANSAGVVHVAKREAEADPYILGYSGYGYAGLGYAGLGYAGYHGYGSYSPSAGVSIAGHAPAALPAVAGAYAGAGRYCANSAGTIHCA